MSQAVVTVDSIKKVDKGSLRAFATVTIAGKLTINSIRIIQQAEQSAWVSLPQNEVKAADGGRSKYFPIVEVHDDPSHALTDGAQSITPKVLEEMMPTLKKIAEAIGRSL